MCEKFQGGAFPAPVREQLQESSSSVGLTVRTPLNPHRKDFI